MAAKHPGLVGRWAGPASIALAGLAMFVWTWGTWPDVLIDFGRELYTAWQLAAGKVLYRDIAYFNGPLSPYWNALWFRFFGVSIRTLIVCNAALLVVSTCLLYRLLRVIADLFSVTVACLLFIMLFAFGNFTPTGNYNYLCPYSHEMTHGLLFSLAALTALEAFSRRPEKARASLAGLFLGLTFLTKAEMSLAACLGVLVGFVVILWLKVPVELISQPPQLGVRGSGLGAKPNGSDKALLVGPEPPAPSPEPRKVLKQALNSRRLALCAALVGGACVPPALAWALLRLVLPPGQALAGILGTWPWLSHADVLSLPFYRYWRGTLDTGQSLRVIGGWIFGDLVVFVPPLLLESVSRRLGRARKFVSFAWLLTLGVTLLGFRRLNWSDAFRPLPVMILGLATVTLVSIRRSARAGLVDSSLVSRFSLTVFAGALLAKMGLYARIHNYGFVLAMPATMLTALALLDWIPRWIEGRRGEGAMFRSSALLVLNFVTLAYLLATVETITHKSYRVGSGADTFLADYRALGVTRMSEEIRHRLTGKETLVAIPHGPIINYLTRRLTPIPYLVIDPVIIQLYGERQMLETFKAHPPDYVLFVPVNMTEHGVEGFGIDYGTELYGWIRGSYSEVARLGVRTPLGPKEWVLLHRR